MDPVFLVAPKPQPPTLPTRRAFLLAGATFTLGAAVGGACGYSVGVTQASVGAGAEVDSDLTPTRDADLDELRRLAVKAPIQELIEKRLVFLNCLSKDYRNDEVLWRGVERLCRAVQTDASFPDRRISARLLAQVIELGDPPFSEVHSDAAKQLRAIR
ncbi:MAG: hypothetical protein KF830_03805 [Planctomycetes bacterium]|nr:hypothetical protein [Planctomycetota bacterium]